jgi:hypothetical protein
MFWVREWYHQANGTTKVRPVLTAKQSQSQEEKNLRPVGNMKVEEAGAEESPRLSQKANGSCECG